MSDNNKPLVAVRDDEQARWMIFGKTYEMRDEIKNAGLEWNPTNKSWVWTDTVLPASIRSMAWIATSTTIPEGVTVIEKIVEKIVEKPVSKHKLRRGHNTRKPRPTDDRKPRLHAAAVETPQGFVPPSYWSDLLLYLSRGNSRPAGNGKTTVAEKALTVLGYKYEVIDATEYLEPADIVGSMTYHPQNGEIWRDAAVGRAFRNGHAVIVNEFDALNPRAALCLQSAFQDAGGDKQGRYVTTPGCADHDRIYPANDCPIILTMNTYGSGATRQYVGRNALDAASADRLTIISTAYENEEAILTGRGFRRETAGDLAKWAKEMRTRIDDNALRIVLSNRTLIRMAQAIDQYGWSFKTAVEKEFLGRMETDVREMIENSRGGRHGSVR